MMASKGQIVLYEPTQAEFDQGMKMLLTSFGFARRMYEQKTDAESKAFWKESAELWYNAIQREEKSEAFHFRKIPILLKPTTRKELIASLYGRDVGSIISAYDVLRPAFYEHPCWCSLPCTLTNNTMDEATRHLRWASRPYQFICLNDKVHGKWNCVRCRNRLH